MIDWEYEALHGDIDVIKQHIDNISGQFTQMSLSVFKSISGELYDGMLLHRNGSDAQRIKDYQEVMRHFYDKWINVWIESSDEEVFMRQFSILKDSGSWLPKEYRDNGLTVDLYLDLWDLIGRAKKHPTLGTLFERREEDQKFFWSFFGLPINEFKYLLDVLYDENSELINNSLCEKMFINYGHSIFEKKQTNKRFFLQTYA